MDREEIEKRIIKVFESTRYKPGSYYNPQNFMNYLVSPPSSKNQIQNSFVGIRRYHMFMENLERAFEICFTLSDLDKEYSIEKLCDKIIERKNKAKGNRMIITRRIESGEKFYFELTLTIIAIFIIWKWWVSIPAIVFSSFLLFCAYWIGSSKWRSLRHNKEMAALLLKN